MLTDSLADMFTRIRNANSIGRKSVPIPASRMKVGVAEVLRTEGYIQDYEVVEGKPSSTLRIRLKYGPDGEKVIRSIDRVSKPGRRVYMGVKELPPVLRGLGILILSTPQGVVSDRSARKLNVGGEVLCRIT
jgi:small subunit ribosomal protein S8